MKDTITSETQALSRRLESARALLRYWCGPHSYQRAVLAAVNVLDCVFSAQLECEGFDAEEIIQDALERARDVVGDVEKLRDATWRAKLSPGLN